MSSANQNAKIVLAVVSPDELAYLINLVGANRAYGIDDSLWHDDGNMSLGKRLDRGFDLLVQNGWLTVEGESEGSPRYVINPNLVLMAATLADPDMVFVTRRYLPNQEVQVVTHYLTEHLLLEQIKRADGSYRLMCLPTHAAMIERLAISLDIPLPKDLEEKRAIDLSWSTIRTLDQMLRHRQDHDAHGTQGDQPNVERDLLIEAGIEDAESKLLESIFLNASPVAKVEIGRVFGAKLLALQSLLLFEVDGEVWSVQSRGGEHSIALAHLDKERFANLIHASIVKMSDVHPVLS